MFYLKTLKRNQNGHFCLFEVIRNMLRISYSAVIWKTLLSLIVVLQLQL